MSRHPPVPEDRGRAPQGAVDRETGEILGAPEPERRGPVELHGEALEGERTIPSVNRERSIQSRISSALALATVVLLGAGFLFWYYGTQYARTRDAEQAAAKAASARAAGEMKLPPLGRVDPPAPPAAIPVPAAASAAAQPAGGPAPSKSPEQLALERQLAAPVLRRAAAAAPVATASPVGAAAALPAFPFTLPGLPHQADDAGAGGAQTLAARLAPTPTPAATAGLLPTQRLLLPKGTFIDCTLETAIDSTHPGMATCIGATDVYGADGKVVLLERGTKYVGEQRGEPRHGQARVFVLWNEARTPAGVVVPLASPGTDALGRSGLPGFVDTHFWERFGGAVLVSVIDGAVQALAARERGGTPSGGTVVLNPQGTRDVVAEMLRGTIAIPPTVIKNQGERIQILVARDVDFRSVHALRSEPARP